MQEVENMIEQASKELKGVAAENKKIMQCLVNTFHIKKLDFFR